MSNYYLALNDLAYVMEYTLLSYLERSDLDLRHSLANIVAVVVGSPSESNHMWYHLFAPGKLTKSYMTGFTVS